LILDANSIVLMTNPKVSIKLFCASTDPQGLNLREAKEVVLQALENWAEFRNLPASVVVWMAASAGRQIAFE